MQKMVKRMVGVLVALMVGAALFAGTAGAHMLTVNNRGNGAPEARWVGGNGASHGKGLVTACEVQHAHGRSAALIDTPWNSPANCTHMPDVQP